LLNTLRAALAEEQHLDKQRQTSDHAGARERLRARYPPFPGFERWLRNQGQEIVAEQWRYRECAREVVQRVASTPQNLDASRYGRFAGAWSKQHEARRAAIDRAWAEYARDVARVKTASKQRWAGVSLVAKGRVAGELWALTARLADHQAWRQLHRRHRATLQAVDRQYQSIDWASWPQSISGTDDSARLGVHEGHRERSTHASFPSKSLEVTGAEPHLDGQQELGSRQRQNEGLQQKRDPAHQRKGRSR
jgi:hypothetical protein